MLVLITDLYEGGDADEMLARVRDAQGRAASPSSACSRSTTRARRCYDASNAAAFAALGVPTFACTPDAFPELMAAALGKRDVGQWASERGIVGAR